jgi:hypothetical protein
LGCPSLALTAEILEKLSQIGGFWALRVVAQTPRNYSVDLFLQAKTGIYIAMVALPASRRSLDHPSQRGFD